MDRDQAIAIPAAAASAAAAPPTLRIALRPHDALPWLLMPQGVALEVLIDASAVRVPNTNDWFHGVVSQRGNLLPIFDLATWAGLHVEPDRPRQVIVVGLPSRMFGLMSDATPALVQLQGMDGKQAGYTGALSPYLTFVHADGREEAYEFDASTWLAHVSQQISRTADIVPR